MTTVAGSPGQPGYQNGAGAAARFNAPAGASFAQGQLFIADMYNDEVRQFDPGSGLVTTLAGYDGYDGSTDGTGQTARFFEPADVVADGQGHVYVADTNNDTVRQVTYPGGVVTTLLGLAPHAGEVDGAALTGAEFDAPLGLCSDGTNLYVVDNAGCAIRQIDLATATVTTLAGGGYGSSDGVGTAADFAYPTACACDQAGNVYVSDTDNGTIRKIAIASRLVTTVAGTVSGFGFNDGPGDVALFESPTGLAFDSATGSLYIADNENCRIRQYDPSTQQVSTLAGNGAFMDTDGQGALASLYVPYSLYSPT